MLFLVRHGRPIVDLTRPSHEWELDPAGYDDVWELRDKLPAAAAWFCSPERKAVATAQLLTDGPVGIVDGLREQVRDTTDWLEDFEDTVARAFDAPDVAAYDGWEPLAKCRERLLDAVRPILHVHGGEDVVLVGHGTAWTVLAAALTGQEPDPDRWRALAMPDLIAVEV